MQICRIVVLSRRRQRHYQEYINCRFTLSYVVSKSYVASKCHMSFGVVDTWQSCDNWAIRYRMSSYVIVCRFVCRVKQFNESKWWPLQRCFGGLSIKSNAIPVKHPIRIIPFEVEANVKDNLKTMKNMGYFERIA